MKRHHILILVTSILMLSAAAADLVTNAQDKPALDQVKVVGSLKGVVTDETGAVVPGVKVTLVSGRVRRETTTDESGRYTFNKVPIGSYRLLFHVQGFRRMERRDVQVEIGRTSQTNIQLQRGPEPTPSPAPSPSATSTPTPTALPPPASPTPTNAATATPATTPTVLPSPVASPSATATPTSGDPDIEAAVANLVDRAIAFNPPSEMRQGSADIISARITFQELPKEVLIEGLPGSGKPQVEPIKVSSVMKVVLIGDKEAFFIQNLSSEEQAVAGKQFAQWEWNVTPLASGNQQLFLRASATIATPRRGEKTVDIPVMHRTINVRVDPLYASKRFIANNWQWLWTALIVPVALAIWKLKKGKTATPAS